MTINRWTIAWPGIIHTRDEGLPVYTKNTSISDNYTGMFLLVFITLAYALIFTKSTEYGGIDDIYI